MSPTARPSLDPRGVGSRTDRIDTVGMPICTDATARIPVLGFIEFGDDGLPETRSA